MTYLYKENPGAAIVEALVVGATAANAAIQALYQIWGTIGTNILTRGQWYYLLGLFVGITFFFILVPGRTGRTLFRYSTMFVFGITLANLFPTETTQAFSGLTAASRIRSISDIFYTIPFILALTYFLWNTSLEKYIKPSITAGKYVMFLFMAFVLPQLLLARVSGIAGLFQYEIFAGPGVIALVAFGIAILIDAAYGWNKILGRKKVAELAK